MTRATSLGFLYLAVASSLWAGELPKRFTQVVKGKDSETSEFDMVLIPGGIFTMGSPATEKGRKKDEGPQHKVRIKPFYLCTTEATIELWRIYAYSGYKIDERGRPDPMTEWREATAKVTSLDAITGPTLAYGDLTMGKDVKRQPMICTSWFHAMIFCKWLSLKTGKTYRLPTEAEWEYACRAGTTTAYSFGDGPRNLDDYAWYEDSSELEPMQVAQKKPNPWGLYDMHGNMAEWCIDFYSAAAYAGRARSAVTDGTKPLARGKMHVARGGAWDLTAVELRSAARAAEESWWSAQDAKAPKSRWWLPRHGVIGFRVACDVPKPKGKASRAEGEQATAGPLSSETN
ncbi:MAG: formylglycine-generating enzyme family protein [Candidatus Brocadiae bacterium]|nr:formylglycine-generating enzyme family protein [Candidatus Brocadiia bacterium]